MTLGSVSSRLRKYENISLNKRTSSQDGIKDLKENQSVFFYNHHTQSKVKLLKSYHYQALLHKAIFIATCFYKRHSSPISSHLQLWTLFLLPEQGSKKVLFGQLGQVDFCVRQVTFPTHLPDGQGYGQGYEQAACELS